MMIVLGSVVVSILFVVVFLIGVFSGCYAFETQSKEYKKFKEDATKREEAFKLALIEKDNLLTKIMLAGVKANSSPEIWGVDSEMVTEEQTKTNELIEMIEANSVEMEKYSNKIKRKLFGLSYYKDD